MYGNGSEVHTLEEGAKCFSHFLFAHYISIPVGTPAQGLEVDEGLEVEPAGEKVGIYSRVAIHISMHAPVAYNRFRC